MVCAWPAGGARAEKDPLPPSHGAAGECTLLCAACSPGTGPVFDVGPIGPASGGPAAALYLKPS